MILGADAAVIDNAENYLVGSIGVQLRARCGFFRSQLAGRTVERLQITRQEAIHEMQACSVWSSKVRCFPHVINED